MNKKISSNKAIYIALIGALVLIISVSLYRLLSPRSLLHLAGSWKVTEKLKSKKYISEIDWQYSADIINKDTLRLSGKKIKINKKEPNKQEKTAISIYNCKFKGRQSDCKFDELNSSNPVFSGEAKLEFKETFEAFNGNAYENGKEVSTLTGYKQQGK